MAVIVKYVVVWDGKEDMSFTTKQEAEAHDTMLAIAERLSTLLATAELNLADETLEAITLFMAQHREHLSTILKGRKLKTPAVRTAPAALPQDKRGESSSSEPQRSKASPSAAPTQPQVAA